MRTEKDSMGELQVADNALWGAQTERARLNFPISNLTMPKAFIQSLALIKKCAAIANIELKLLDQNIGQAIIQASEEIINGNYLEQFPVDVFQTGSGTSSNMNANEVIANIASKIAKTPVHPNDHVNMGQSSNDIIPTTIHTSAAFQLKETLLPSLQHLSNTLATRIVALEKVVKTGRTHLMDAMPLTFGQELSGYKQQIDNNIARITNVLPRLHKLALGGTAIGTGINAHPDFALHVCKELTKITALAFTPSDNYFEALSCQDTALELSSQLKVLAASLMKMANDFRLMNSGPLSGFGEISLPAVQPGSSIMPGKVNPVIAEAVCMVAAQVIGNDTTITVAAQAGNFQLNVMLPVIAHNLLQSIEIISQAINIFTDKIIAGFIVNTDKIQHSLALNPILVTALNPVIGYEKGAEIAKTAYIEQRPVIEVAMQKTNLSRNDLERLLDPLGLTKGGIKN